MAKHATTKKFAFAAIIGGSLALGALTGTVTANAAPRVDPGPNKAYPEYHAPFEVKGHSMFSPVDHPLFTVNSAGVAPGNAS